MSNKAMTEQHLRLIVRESEGLKLDFKREYKLASEPPNGTDTKLWKQFVRGQWDELIKDVLSLANGNIGTCGQPARLIIGVDDDVAKDGSRALFDTSYLALTRAQLLERINKACTPPICDIRVEQVVLDEKAITVITIPPTPFVHETTRPLVTTRGEFDDVGRLRFCRSGSHSEHTVFLRRGDGIYPARYPERHALAREKEQANTVQIERGVRQQEDEPSPMHPTTVSRSGVNELCVAGLSDILDWGWDGIRLLKEFIRLDYATLDALLPSHEGSPEQWAPVFMNHPATWRMLISGQEQIQGYWHFAPLFDDDYARAKAGRLFDSEITADRIRLFEIPGEYDLYFVQLCLHPRYRQPIHVRTLFRSILDVLDELAADGIFVREMCANAYTDVGRAICRSFNLVPLGDHAEHGVIFSGPMEDVLKSPLGTLNPNLAERYRSAGSAILSPDETIVTSPQLASIPTAGPG